MTVTRFAPSPTGRLHVGNLRTAILNWLTARAGGGRFLLRIDDTDAERSTEAFVAAIRADLAWLGLHPDGEVRQSARAKLYEDRFATLRAAGRVYPCWETPQELELKRKVAAGRGLPPIYDRAALTAPPGEGPPHWRFLLDHGAPMAWDDGVRGPQAFDPALVSDPVVRRADGSWLYLLPSVIDDIDLGITDVVRGEDHVANTAIQLQMFAALDAAPPRFAHTALLVASEGKLSKRLGSLGCDELRADGIEPGALIAFLARLGTSQPVVPAADAATLAATHDFAHFGRAPARFDADELAQVNAKRLHATPFATVAARLPAGMDGDAWAAIRPNLSRLDDAAGWWAIVTGPVDAPPVDPADHAFLDQAATIAAATDWQADPWHAITRALAGASGRKGKALFLPLRRALTGRDHGPDMAALLPLIAQADAVARLRGGR